MVIFFLIKFRWDDDDAIQNDWWGLERSNGMGRVNHNADGKDILSGSFCWLYPELRNNEGNKHWNNTLASAKTVHHESTYFILFLTWHNEYINDIKKQRSSLVISVSNSHEVQFSCAITQPLLAYHWRVHQCLLTSRFIAPSIPLGVSTPGGKMRKQFLSYHNFLNNSPIFII